MAQRARLAKSLYGELPRPGQYYPELMPSANVTLSSAPKTPGMKPQLVAEASAHVGQTVAIAG
jgi:hypothetical protein